MPGIVEVWAQRCRLRERLQAAALTSKNKEAWRDASGTIIMQHVFTQEMLYNGCEDFLYLFQHCATKTSCEAVVEGMGSVWDASAPSRRHVGFEAGVRDAVVAWSAPMSHLRAADAFITRSLNTYFEGGPDKWNFKNEDPRFRMSVYAGGSKVIAKWGRQTTRLPADMYAGE